MPRTKEDQTLAEKIEEIVAEAESESVDSKQPKREWLDELEEAQDVFRVRIDAMRQEIERKEG